MMLAALLLAAAQPLPTPAWLTGDWVHITEASREDDHACTDEESKSWHGDGSYEDSSGEGSWHLAGASLTEIDGDGVAHHSLVRRIGPNRMQITDQDGDKGWLARCRRR